LGEGNILNKGLVLQAALLGLGGVLSGIADALPPPKSVDALFHDADLVIEGQVYQVSLYRQWLSQVSSGEFGDEGGALLKNLPDSDEGLLSLLRNFPYKPAQVSIEGIYIAEIKIKEVLKGSASGRIFIPFVRYHFLPGRSVEGPWSERIYQPGEHLRLYLKKNGPFYQSVWWNAVQPVN
jgi:hypothetical protein